MRGTRTVPGATAPLALVLALVLAACGAARATSDVSCGEGTAAEAARRYEDAASGFLACAARATAPGEQAWGLSRAARVLGTKLFRFDEALALLDRLSRDYPTDPRAVAAQGLAAEIRAGRASGDEALQLYYTIRERPELLDREQRFATLRRIVAEYPSFPMVDWVMRTLAVELRDRGDIDGSLAVLADMRTRFAGQPAGANAWLETGGTYFAAGRFTEAAAWYRRWAEFGGLQSIGEANEGRALAHRARQRLERAAIALIVAWLAWVLAATRWRRATTVTLRHATRELWVIAPIWALLVAVSFRTNTPIQRSIWWMGASTALVVTLSNLLVLTREPGPRARALHLGLTAATIVATVYLTLYRYDLVFTLEDTLRLGPGAG